MPPNPPIDPNAQSTADAANAAAVQAAVDKIVNSSPAVQQARQDVKDWGIEATKAIANTAFSFDTFENALGAIVGRAETGIADFGIGNIKKFIESVESKSIVQGTKQTADFIQEVTGMNALAIDNSVYGINTASKQLSDAAYKAAKDYGQANITLLSGVTLHASTLLGDAKELYAGFKDTVLDDTRLFNAGVKGMSYDILENIKLTTATLKMQPRELNEVFQRELSATGEISGEMLKTYEKTTLAVAQSTGQVPAMVAQDLAKMLGDFNHFGAITIPQMGSLSATLHQMGLAINDVTKLADNFSSFDKAVQVMSNLSATTGATLDTLGLFQLANTDQEQFIVSLREQLESQGVEFENMNILQQKQIASAFGIDPVILQRLLNDNFDSIESMNADITSRVSGMTDETMQQQLVDMGGLVKAAEKLSSKDLIERQMALENASAGFAKTIENSFRSTVLVTEKAVEAMGQARLDAMQGLLQIKDTIDNISESGNRIFSKGKAPPATSTPASTGPETGPPATAPPQPAASPAATPILGPGSGPAATPEVPSPAAAPEASTARSPSTMNITREEAQTAGLTGGNQHVVATVSPTSPTATRPASPPATTQSAETESAPAATPPTARAGVTTQRIEIALVVSGDGTAISEALASQIAASLQNGVNVNGNRVTFNTTGPTEVTVVTA